MSYRQLIFLRTHLEDNRRRAKALIAEANRRNEPNHPLAVEARAMLAKMDELERDWDRTAAPVFIEPAA